MKASIISMLLTLCLLVLGPMVYFKWGGREYLSSMSSPARPELKLNKDVVYAPVTTDRKIKVYKWQDENGIWQFGSVPPNGVRDVQEMNLQPDVNVMKPVDVPKTTTSDGRGGVVVINDKRNGAAVSEEGDAGGLLGKDALENPYDPKNINKLVESANKLQDVFNQRSEAQQRIGGE